ncbi:hypothetical protein C0J52_18255 [Blattella germanica]|nr:hypothetical protein C0J52_18255 [Blattella germanica]
MNAILSSVSYSFKMSSMKYFLFLMLLFFSISFYLIFNLKTYSYSTVYGMSNFINTLHIMSKRLIYKMRLRCSHHKQRHLFRRYKPRMNDFTSEPN